MLGLLHRLLSVCDGVWSTLSALGVAISSGDNSKGRENLLWWHDLARCHAGNISITVAQANLVLEDLSYNSVIHICI